MPDELPEREIVMVLGKTGMGKTRWTKRYLARRKRVIISDPILEYEGRLFDDINELNQFVDDYPTFRVRSMHTRDIPMLAAVSMAAGKKYGDCTLAVEETQSHRMLQSRQELPDVFEHVIYRGRHREYGNVSLVLVSQRPTTIHIAARSQWRRLIVFQQTEGADLRWLQGQTGLDEDEFFTLRPGEYWEATPFSLDRKMLPDQRAQPGEAIKSLDRA